MVHLVQVNEDDQNNIALTCKQFPSSSFRPWPTLATCQPIRRRCSSANFEKVFTNFHNPHKDYGSNRMFQNDLKEALEKDAACTTKPTLQGLLTATQFVMNSWEKDAFRSRQRTELGVDTKRKGPPTSTISKKRTRADATSKPDHLKATVGEHCQGVPW